METIKEKIPDYIDQGLLGQEKLKNKLNFHIHNQHKSGFLPFILFQAPKGSGKTLFARQLARNLKNLDGSKRRAIELNGSSIGSVIQFFDEVLTPNVLSGQEITVFIDEIAEVTDKVIGFLLSIMQPDLSNVSSITRGGQTYDFDFHKFNFICATTNSEQLRETFKSRFKKIEIEPYNNATLVQILFRHTDCLTYHNGVENEIAKVCRFSPREVVLRAKDINSYCKIKEVTSFDQDNWIEFKDYFDIKPLGLGVKEVELLRYLKTGPKSLTSIMGKLQLDMQTVRKEVELFCLSNNLLNIDLKRKITDKGLKILDEIDSNP